MKKFLSISLVLSFIFVFSVSVGAANDIIKTIENIRISNRTINVMDFKTKTIIDQLSLSEIPDYSSQTDTTYNLSSMQSLNLPEINLNEIRDMAENSLSPTGIIYPDPGLLNTFFPYSPLTGIGTPRAPYAGVVALYIDSTNCFNNQRLQGIATGFLVSPTVMITAAHCVVDSSLAEIHEVRVYPFTHQDERPDLTNNDYVTINNVQYDSQFARFPNQDGLDWAIVILDEPINNAYYFSCTYDATTTFLNTVARVIGYPGGNPAITGYYELGYHLYMSMGNIVEINTLTVQHEAASLSGNSGSPIIGNGNLCCAIHTHEYIDFDNNYNEIYSNYGTRITTSIYNYICNAIETN